MLRLNYKKQSITRKQIDNVQKWVRKHATMWIFIFARKSQSEYIGCFYISDLLQYVAHSLTMSYSYSNESLQLLKKERN